MGRVMAVMLFLRYYSKELERPPVRIIGEIAVDSTEELALVPRGGEGGDPAMPDFVNVNTIYSRALCQDLAFPRLQPATRQLFAALPGGPQVVMRRAECFVRLGEDLKFATVKAQVRHLKNRDVCLGYRTHDGNIEMAPALTSSHVYVQGDHLVIITRDCDDEDIREEEEGDDREEEEEWEESELSNQEDAEVFPRPLPPPSPATLTCVNLR